MITKKRFSILFLIVLFLISVNSELTAIIVFNGSGTVYGDNNSEGKIVTLTAPAATIESYVVTGATCFLNYNKDMMAYSSMVEQSDAAGLDYYECVQTLNSAITNIQGTISTYEALIKQAENTPYNNSVISKLAAFDYAGYLKANGLNSVIFSKVEGYLKRGDITGVFKYNLVQFKAIRDLLNKLKYSNDTSTIPDIPNIWKVNESTSETLVFGQYVARIFSAIK